MVQKQHHLAMPECCCGGWESPDGYPGAMWDRSEDWCPIHGANRQRTLARLRRIVRTGKLTWAEYRIILKK